MTSNFENPNIFCDQHKKLFDTQSFHENFQPKILPGFTDLTKPIPEAESNTPKNKKSLLIDSALQRFAKKNLPCRELAGHYLKDKYRKNQALNTIKSTVGRLELFLAFIKQKGKKTIEEVTKDDLAGFVESQQDQNFKIVTVKCRLVTVYAFIQFLVDKEEMPLSKLLEKKLRLKLPEALPRAMDPYDIKLLLKVKGSIRNKAIIMILLRTGMRIGELLATKVSDVNMERQKIMIYLGAKNYLGRSVCFSDDAKEALQAWLEQRDKTVQLLFYGNRDGKLCYEAARSIFINYLKAAGLEHKEYTLHSLRHTFATELLNAGMHLECLQQLMGHRCIEMTRRYARLTNRTREDEYFKAMSKIERQKDENNKLDSEL